MHLQKTMRNTAAALLAVLGAGGCTQAPTGTEPSLPVDSSPPATPAPATAEPGKPPITADCDEHWCRIPAGSYVKGSPRDEPLHDHLEDQAPVTLTRPFLMQRYETTHREWRESPTGPWTPAREGDFPRVDPNDLDAPITGTTWSEAALYANRLSERDGYAPCYRLEDCAEADLTYGTGVTIRLMNCQHTSLARDATAYDCEGYRLPTQAEWEYAVRAGTTTMTYAGPHDPALYAPPWDGECLYDQGLDEIAWYCFNSGGHLQRVGLKRSNAFGLFDMLGNTDEWGHSHFKPWSEPDAPLPLVDPTGGLDPTDRSRVLLGYGVGYQQGMVKSAGFDGSRWDFSDGGIRLVRTLKPNENWRDKP